MGTVQPAPDGLDMGVDMGVDGASEEFGLCLQDGSARSDQIARLLPRCQWGRPEERGLCPSSSGGED